MKARMRQHLHYSQVVKERRRQVILRMQRKALLRAKSKTGSDGKTAAVLAITPQRLCDIKAGRRPMPPAVAARLANLLNLDSFTAMAQAMANNAKSKTSRTFWVEFGHDLWFQRHRRLAIWDLTPKLKKYPS